MAEFTWFFYSIIATISFGFVMAILKLPSAKKISGISMVGWSLLTTSALAFIFFWDRLFPLNYDLLLIAVIWAVFFVSLTLLQVFSLKHIDANKLFPMTTTLSLIVTVVVGVTFFGDNLSYLQWLGIILIVFTVYTFLRKNTQLKFSYKVLIVALGLIAFSATHKTLNKVAADSFDIFTYLFYQHFLAFILMLVLLLIYHKGEVIKSLVKGPTLIGLLQGAIAFVAVLFWLIALSKGPFAPIMAIHSTYVLITSIITSIFFKEKLTGKIFLLTLVAILGIIFIRIG